MWPQPCLGLQLLSFAHTLWVAPKVHRPPAPFPLGSSDLACLSLNTGQARAGFLGRLSPDSKQRVRVRQWLSGKPDFLPQATFGNVWGHWGESYWHLVGGGTGDTAKHPTTHRPGQELSSPRCQVSARLQNPGVQVGESGLQV